MDTEKLSAEESQSFISEAINGKDHGPFDIKRLNYAFECGSVVDNDGEKNTLYNVVNKLHRLTKGDEKVNEENFQNFFKMLIENGMELKGRETRHHLENNAMPASIKGFIESNIQTSKQPMATSRSEIRPETSKQPMNMNSGLMKSGWVQKMISKMAKAKEEKEGHPKDGDSR